MPTKNPSNKALISFKNCRKYNDISVIEQIKGLKFAALNVAGLYLKLIEIE